MNSRALVRSQIAHIAAIVGVGVSSSLTAPSLAHAATGPAEQYQKLADEFQTAQQTFSKAYSLAKTDAERQKLMATYPQPQQYAGRFLELARLNPKDPVAVDALVWVMAYDRYGPEAGKALGILAKDHLQSDKLGSVCSSLIYSPLSERERFLRDVYAKNPHREVQGQARYSLAMVLKDSAPAEAEGLFNEVAAKFTDVKSYRGTLADAAKSELYEIHNLAIGKVAPDITGEDVDGTRFKLSDYRGKVVVLDFWGDW